MLQSWIPSSVRAGPPVKTSGAERPQTLALRDILIGMLPMWLISLPVWLVIFIVVYALAALYIAIKYREVRKFLAGAFFVSSGILWYLWITDISIPLVMPYIGIVSVETPDISGQRAIIHFILFLLCLYFGFISKPKT
jgi:hypothetical protein